MNPSVIRSGIWIPILLMLPNVFWLVARKQEEPAGGGPGVLGMTEHASRAACLVLPVFLDVEVRGGLERTVLGLMAVVLAGYYFCWGRYFAGGRATAKLWAPLLGLRLPTAVAPATVLVLSAIVLHSWWMLAASGVFGVAHVLVARGEMKVRGCAANAGSE